MRAQGAAGFAGEFAVFDPSGILVPNSEILCAYGESASTGTGIIRVTTNGSADYKIKAWASSGTYAASTDFNGRTGVTWKKISGNAPVTGHSVDYGIARYTGADGSSLSANATVPFDATAQGNLSWSSAYNRFTLKANKTYEIESYLAVYHNTVGVAGIFQIYNFTNSTSLANGLYLSMNGSGGYNVNANGPMRCVITPTTDIEVGVRIATAYGGWPSIIGSTSVVGANGAANQSYLLVKQIGSSAIVNPWVLSGNDVYNTTGEVGIGTASPNASALLDLTSTTKGLLPPRMTTAQRSAISGAVNGLVIYNTNLNQLETYNGSSWNPLYSGPVYFAQYRANAAQGIFTKDVTKVNFPQLEYNFGGGITSSSSNTFTLPENRIYRVDLNMGYKNGGWCRFGIYNTSTGAMVSQTAHMESGTLSGTGVITYFIDTKATQSSYTFDVRMKEGGCTLSDVNNGTTYATITIQSIY